MISPWLSVPDGDWLVTRTGHNAEARLHFFLRGRPTSACTHGRKVFREDAVMPVDALSPSPCARCLDVFRSRS